MKINHYISTFLVMLSFLVVSSAHAVLVDNGNGTVTDDDLGLMWLQSPSTEDMSWADALTWADSLAFAGYDDWRLPTALGFGTGTADTVSNSVNNEFGHLYGSELSNPANLGDIAPLTDYSPLWYWTSTADNNDAYAFFWSFDGLWLNESSANRADMTIQSLLHVTAVRSIGTTPKVPETASILLMGFGLLGLVAFKRRKFS